MIILTDCDKGQQFKSAYKGGTWMLLHLLFKKNNSLCPAEDHGDTAILETVRWYTKQVAAPEQSFPKLELKVESYKLTLESQ